MQRGAERLAVAPRVKAHLAMAHHLVKVLLVQVHRVWVRVSVQYL